MVVPVKLNNNSLKKLLKKENDYILDLLTNFNVPDSVEDPHFQTLLLNTGKSKAEKNLKDDLEDRLNIIKNKMKTKRRKISERSMKKREAKKLKKNKEFKKLLKTAHTTIKNEPSTINVPSTPDINNEKQTKPIFNTSGRTVFSKFDFASRSKSKKSKVVTNTKQALQVLKATDSKLKQLKEEGKEDKAKELKTELAWNKAFQRIDGKKVKDDPELLKKAMKRKKIEKKKSIQQWIERKEKLDLTMKNKQKKRTENIQKKLKDRKNKKLKKMSKKGRVIPGF